MMRTELKLFWRRGMAGPVLVRAVVNEAPLSVREIAPVYEGEDLLTTQAIPSELFDLLCRACEGCSGLHHWMIYMPDPESEEDAEHPAVQAGHTLGFWQCKHCDAWAGIAETEIDDEDQSGPPEPTNATLDRFCTPCCEAAPIKEKSGPYDYRCSNCLTLPVQRFTWWQLLYRPAPITFTDQDLAETMEAANLSEQPGPTEPPNEDA